MPIYKCPKCGRQVELPEGKYYCKVCGPSVIMTLQHNGNPQMAMVVSKAWRRDKYKDGKMVLWHGSPLRFKDSILRMGILPRCSLPITEEQLDKTARDIALKIKDRYGVVPSEEAIERAKYWARIRLEETKGCVYTSADKQYAMSNCLAGDEWIHTIVNYLLGDLKERGLLPKELNTVIAAREFYPDTKCALFELEVPVEEAKAIPENRHFFEVYEGKYNDPKIRKLFAGTDDFYRHVFAVVVLPRISPKYIKNVEVYEKI
jgi:DNA-directed RNA polymerase subunit RPC12/RpoP